MNSPDAQSFFSRSPTIQPLNSISSWKTEDWYDRDSYQQRQLKRLQALVPPVQPPPLQLGYLTPNQEYQVQRLRRLVPPAQPIPTFRRRRPRTQPRTVGGVSQIPPTADISVTRSVRTPGVSPRPRKNRMRRPARGVTRSYPRLRVLSNIITRYGWGICAGTWIVLVISGGLAGKVLMNPEYATTYSASYESPASEMPSQQTENPWSLYGAIGLGGAGVTWLISQCFKPN